MSRFLAGAAFGSIAALALGAAAQLVPPISTSTVPIGPGNHAFVFCAEANGRARPDAAPTARSFTGGSTTQGTGPMVRMDCPPMR